MKILHVVTLASPDAAYGGPLRVALNQVRELRERGHDVTLVAGARGYTQFPSQIDGVDVTLFPAKYAVPRVGFAGLTSRPMRKWLRANVADFDVVHVHFARDLVAIPAARAALRAGSPLLVQTHGMVDKSARLSAHAIDFAATRDVLRRAEGIFYLTDAERDALVAVTGYIRTERLMELPNGVPIAEAIGNKRGDGHVEFLFLGRLALRKRPTWLAQAVIRAAARGAEAVATFVGPDEGEAAAIDALAAQHPGLVRREPAIPSSRTLQRMRMAQVFALPAENEVFSMAVLEAMSVALPVIVMADSKVADAVRETGAGMVARDQRSFDEAVFSLASDSELRRAAGKAASELVSARYSMRSVTDSLEAHYEEALGRAGSR